MSGGSLVWGHRPPALDTVSDAAKHSLAVDGRMIDLDSIVVVGERHVPAMYFEEEHFVILVTTSDVHYSIPRDIEAFEDLVSALEDQFACVLDFKMVSAGTLEGRVLAPAALRDRPLFVIEPVRDGGVIGWLESKLTPEYRERVADDVREFARSATRGR